MLKRLILLFTITLSFTSQALFDEPKALLENEKNTISVFKNSVDSVVHISNYRKVRRGGFFFDFHTTEVVEGEGTGFIWDGEGHIVTNYHVIRGGSKFTVRFHGDKKDYKATLVGTEPTKDIAILKLTEGPKKIKPLPIGSSKDLQVGQKALAIGNPFGLDSTITQGIVSATGRSIQGITGIKIYDMIQTDSSINPGNSGGPLINSAGEVIGVNTIIFSNSGSSAGVGFAVPIDVVKVIVPQVIKYGKVKRAGLGIELVRREVVEYYTGIEVKEGLIIGYVKPGSPAHRAGLKGISEDRRGYYLGDVITGIDNHKIKDKDDIFNILFKYRPGDKVTVKYLRKGKEKETQLKLTDLSKKD